MRGKKLVIEIEFRHFTDLNFRLGSFLKDHIMEHGGPYGLFKVDGVKAEYKIDYTSNHNLYEKDGMLCANSKII